MVFYFLGLRLRVICALLAAAVSLLSSGSIAAAQSASRAQTMPVAGIERAPVVIDGEVLFLLRGISGFPAKQRADEIAGRIKAIARDPSIPISALRVLVAEERAEILAVDRRIMAVFDADAEAEQIEGRLLLAGIYKITIGRSIERYRRERSRAYLLNQGIHAAIVLGLLAALLFVLRWLFRQMGQAVDRHFQTHLKELEARSFRLLSVEELKRAWQGMLQALYFLTAFVLTLACADYALSLFPWTRPIALGGVELLIDPLRTIWNGVVNATPGLIFIAILVVITRYALRLIRLFFGGIAYGTIRPAGFDQDWAWPTYRLVRFAVIAFALVIAYPYIPGSSSAAFKGVSIFIGLLMSLGATSMVANSLAGYTLIYRRAFRVGDRIKVGDTVGDVVAMRQQVTHLRTPKNEEVTIPSSMILNSHVVNYSAQAREGGLILHTTVGIGYETSWRQVEAMLIEAANRTEGLLRDPPPFVLQTNLGDFCVTYEINTHCDRPQHMEQLYSSMHRNILDVFNEHGVQIMTPNYVADSEQPKVVPKDQWYPAPAKPPPTK